MPKGWVLDSSPLIVFGKIKGLDLLARLPGTLVVPRAVVAELAEGRASDPANLWLKTPTHPVKKIPVPILPMVASWDLGKGEMEVVSFAKTHPGYVAVLDDRLARGCADSFSVPVKGTVGVLLWLKKSRKLERVKPYLERIGETDF